MLRKVTDVIFTYSEIAPIKCKRALIFRLFDSAKLVCSNREILKVLVISVKG